MKNPRLILLSALVAFTATAHSESVYKLKDESGNTVYSDRPSLEGTTNLGTVELAPGPSDEERRAAREQAERMKMNSEKMRQSRIEAEQQRQKDQRPATVEEIESSGGDVVDGYRRRDPKARIPIESPDGGEHPIYEPGKGRPVPIAPRPRPRVAR